MVTLPIELVVEILQLAAAVQLGSDPQSAADLQLVSRETRSSLYPVLFYTLCIHWPTEYDDITKSIIFLQRLLANPSTPARAYVQHIVFIMPLRPDLRAILWPECTAAWRLDSVAVGLIGFGHELLLRLHLIPRRLCYLDLTDGMFQYSRLRLFTNPSLQEVVEVRLVAAITGPPWPGGSDMLGTVAISAAANTLRDAAFSQPKIMASHQPSLKFLLHLQLESSVQIPSAIDLIGQILLRSDVILILVLPAISSNELDREACMTLLEELKSEMHAERVSVDLVEGLKWPLYGRTYAAALRTGVHLFNEAPVPLKQFHPGPKVVN